MGLHKRSSSLRWTHPAGGWLKATPGSFQLPTARPVKTFQYLNLSVWPARLTEHVLPYRFSLVLTGCLHPWSQSLGQQTRFLDMYSLCKQLNPPNLCTTSNSTKQVIDGTISTERVVFIYMISSGYLCSICSACQKGHLKF